MKQVHQSNQVGPRPGNINAYQNADNSRLRITSTPATKFPPHRETTGPARPKYQPGVAERLADSGARNPLTTTPHTEPIQLNNERATSGQFPNGGRWASSMVPAGNGAQTQIPNCSTTVAGGNCRNVGDAHNVNDLEDRRNPGQIATSRTNAQTRLRNNENNRAAQQFAEEFGNMGDGIFS